MDSRYYCVELSCVYTPKRVGLTWCLHTKGSSCYVVCTLKGSSCDVVYTHQRAVMGLISKAPGESMVVFVPIIGT